MKIHSFTIFALSLTTALLTACGGGGGGGTTTATTPATVATTGTPTLSVPTPPVTVVPATIVTSTQLGNMYLSLSEEYLAFNLLNAERMHCGFGGLAQNANLNAAAKAHAEYQIVNRVLSHNEDANAYPIGFTGVYAIDRAKAAGYLDAGAVNDEFAVIDKSDKTGLGTLLLRALLNAPYHLKGLMSGNRDVGMSVRSNLDMGTTNTSVFLQIDGAYKTSVGQQLLASTDINTYPCDGSKGVDFILKGETPNPVPGRDLSILPLGSSVYIQVRDGNILTISTASITQISNGRPVTLRPTITSANDPYAPCISGCYKANQAYIVADAPMQANSSYQVNISGTNNAIPFSRSFTFATGNGL